MNTEADLERRVLTAQRRSPDADRRRETAHGGDHPAWQFRGDRREEAEDTAPDEPEYLSDGELDADAPHDPGEAPCPAETAPRGEAPESEPPPQHEEPTETHTTPHQWRRGRPRHARCRVTEVAADDSDDPARATPDPEPIISDPDEDEEESPPSPTRGGWGHAAYPCRRNFPHHNHTTARGGGWTSPSDTTQTREAAGVRTEQHPGAELTQPRR
ncbi:uncharacterized protein LOC134533455 [Bacillus rossius redtenbacheri]|uniref:uncharacterized protein LOC134533455 n=1 Tax=Bacillus rossius redtenbacheri TaxID=93214 RepID=UPI002FDD06DD